MDKKMFRTLRPGQLVIVGCNRSRVVTGVVVAIGGTGASVLIDGIEYRYHYKNLIMKEA